MQRGCSDESREEQSESVFREVHAARCEDTHAMTNGSSPEIDNETDIIPAVRSAPFGLVVCLRFEARMLIESCGCEREWCR